MADSPEELAAQFKAAQAAAAAMPQDVRTSKSEEPPKPKLLSDGTWDLSGGEGKLIKKILVQGSGPLPKKTHTVKCHWISRLMDGTLIEDTHKKPEPKTFQIYHAELQVIQLSLMTMLCGEKALVTTDPCYAYGKNGDTFKHIPENAKMTFEIEFIAVARTREEDYPLAKQLSDEAAVDYRSGKVKIALEKYRKAVSLIDDYYDPQCSPMRQRLLKNLSTVCCRAKQWNECIKWSNKVLSLEDDQPKALLHKARAHMGLGQVKDARETIEHGIRVTAADPEWQMQFIDLKVKLPQVEKENKERESRMFKRMTRVNPSDIPEEKLEIPEETLRREKEAQEKAKAKSEAEKPKDDEHKTE